MEKGIYNIILVFKAQKQAKLNHLGKQAERS